MCQDDSESFRPFWIMPVIAANGIHLVHRSTGTSPMPLCVIKGRPVRSSSIHTGGGIPGVGGSGTLERPGSNTSSRSSAVSPTSPMGHEAPNVAGAAPANHRMQR